ncbi:unnamed protein product, partial [Protopolystoma xenopodis]
SHLLQAGSHSPGSSRFIDFYSLLGCSPTASQKKLKSALRAARLTLHPDKNIELEEKEQEERRQQYTWLEQAWRVLGDPVSRRQYDCRRLQDILMLESSGCPVQGYLHFTDFIRYSDNLDHSDNGSDCKLEAKYDSGTELHSHPTQFDLFITPCRCGGFYTIDEVAFTCRAKFAKCSDCSLAEITCVEDMSKSHLKQVTFSEGVVDNEKKDCTSLPNLSSQPLPFQILPEDRKSTRKFQAFCLRQAVYIVDCLGNYNPTLDELALALHWLDQDHFDDVAVERNAYKRCGYVLCDRPRGEEIRQQYRIVSRDRRVYEVGDRKRFCSDWCYQASEYLRRQISSDPVWCRNYLPKTTAECRANLRLLSKSAKGKPGRALLDGMSYLRCSDGLLQHDNPEPEVSEPNDVLTGNDEFTGYTPSLTAEQPSDAELALKNNPASAISSSHDSEPFYDKYLWGTKVVPPSRNMIFEDKRKANKKTDLILLTSRLTLNDAKELFPSQSSGPYMHPSKAPTYESQAQDLSWEPETELKNFSPSLCLVFRRLLDWLTPEAAIFLGLTIEVSPKGMEQKQAKDKLEEGEVSSCNCYDDAIGQNDTPCYPNPEETRRHQMMVSFLRAKAYAEVNPGQIAEGAADANSDSLADLSFPLVHSISQKRIRQEILLDSIYTG